jgi:phage recombination protein Bet
MTAIVKHQQEHSREQLDLIKRTFAVGASDDEFSLFLATTKRLNLDIMARQAYCVPRWNNEAKRKVYQTQVSIDGFRLVAERTGTYEGQTAPQWCGPDGTWRDVWLGQEPPAAARVGVFRKGHREPTFGVATLAEFCQWTRDNKPSGQWGSMPAIMLLKCAESQALRKAFPNDLSGVYSEEEMMQADNGVHLREAAAQETAIAESQARLRSDSDKLADDYEVMVNECADAKALEKFCDFNGYELRIMHANAKSRVWRRMLAAAEKHGVKPNDMSKWVRESPEPLTGEEEIV